MLAPERMSPAVLVPVAGAILALSAAGAAEVAAVQERQIVSNRVVVSDSDATLSLEFDSGAALEISLRDGGVWVNGEEIGSDGANGELAAAWRALLSEVISLDYGPLAAALRAWEPGERVAGETRLVAARLEETLEAVLANPAPAAGAALQTALGAQAGGATEGMNPAQLRLLLQRSVELEQALQGVDLSLPSLHVGEDVTIDDGREVEGTLVVVEGDATILGEVSGDVVVVGGSLRISGDAHIHGEVRLVDGRLERDGGTVEGAVRTLDDPPVAEPVTRADPGASEEQDPSARDRDAEAGFRPLRHIMSGLAGLFGDIFGLVIVVALGFVVVHFAGNRLQNVADAAVASPGRAALVGLAGGFLLLPVWVLGSLALLVSIVGIPLLIVWLPFFPLAAFLAHGLGYLAVAIGIGEWLARRGIPALDRIRPSNQLHVLGAGAAALVLPSAFSHVAEMGGSSLGSFLSGLFTFLSVAIALAALTVGFGAVLLTGAGRTSSVDDMAATYGSGYRATRAWTRWRSRRAGREDYGHRGGDPTREQHPEPEDTSRGGPA